MSPYVLTYFLIVAVRHAGPSCATILSGVALARYASGCKLACKRLSNIVLSITTEHFFRFHSTDEELRLRQKRLLFAGLNNVHKGQGHASPKKMNESTTCLRSRVCLRAPNIYH